MHNIKIGSYKFTLPGNYKELSTAEGLYLVESLIEATDGDLKTLFLIKKLGERVYLLKKLNDVQLAQILVLLNWMDPDVLPTLPLVSSFELNKVTYYSPKSDMRAMSGNEFALLDLHLKGLKDDPDKLNDLCSVFYREMVDGKRCVLEEDDMERRAKIFKDLDPRYKMAAFFYLLANKERLEKTFGPIFQGGGSQDQLGWVGAFVSIAETGILGDYQNVKDSPINEICTILYKKHLDKKDLEND